MTLIGQRWKRRKACSWLILISRGLDLQLVVSRLCKWSLLPLLRFLVVFGFQGVSHYPPLAQLVEQLTLNQWVPGSNPWRRTTRPVGQAVKTAASHAANMGSIPVRVTTYSFLKERVSRKNFMLDLLRYRESSWQWDKNLIKYLLLKKTVRREKGTDLFL